MPGGFGTLLGHDGRRLASGLGRTAEDGRKRRRNHAGLGHGRGHIARAFVRRRLPAFEPDPVETETCLYTTTRDSGFLVDRHPESPAVVVGAGFSGHGFKFCSVVGEILADLALDGETRHDIGLFSLGRFS